MATTGGGGGCDLHIQRDLSTTRILLLHYHSANKADITACRTLNKDNNVSPLWHDVSKLMPASCLPKSWGEEQ